MKIQPVKDAVTKAVPAILHLQESLSEVVIDGADSTGNQL